MPELKNRRSARGRTPSGAPNPIDVHVGGRIRLRRSLLGMSQEQLGAALGLTFQQVQKYERGANRVGASRLFDLSRILDVPVSFFFDDITDDVASFSPRTYALGYAEEPPALSDNTLARTETIHLVRAYYSIPDPRIRRKVMDLAQALGNSKDGA